MSSDFQFFEHIPTYFHQHPKVQKHVQAYLSLCSPPSSLVRNDFYSVLCETLLKLWKIPLDARSRYRELRPLFQLIEHFHPYYFTSDQILKELKKCQTISESDVSRLLEAIVTFFKILRVTALNPKQLVISETLELWYSIFSKHHEWEAFNFLRGQGILMVPGYTAFRAWYRYTQGRLPPLENSPREWIQILLDHDVWPDRLEELHLQVSAFSGELEHWGVEGICGELPNCHVCPLKPSCQWQTSVASQASTQELAETLIQKTQMNTLSMDTLLAHLLAVDFQVSRTFLAQLPKNNPLRFLDTLTLFELGEKIGSASIAEKIKLLLELCKRYNEERLIPGMAFQSSYEIFQHFRYRLRDLKQEVFLIVLLNNKHQYLIDQEITKGILNKSLVHPREVFSAAIEYRAAAIICVHNHPSGDPKASQADLDITRRLVESSRVIGIPILDHIIIGNDSYYSFADEGVL